MSVPVAQQSLLSLVLQRHNEKKKKDITIHRPNQAEKVNEADDHAEDCKPLW